MSNAAKTHRHGWDCFKTSGGYTTAIENDGGTWAEKVERIYRTAYRTGYKNGRLDQARGLDNEVKNQ